MLAPWGDPTGGLELEGHCRFLETNLESLVGIGNQVNVGPMRRSHRRSRVSGTLSFFRDQFREPSRNQVNVGPMRRSHRRSGVSGTMSFFRDQFREPSGNQESGECWAHNRGDPTGSQDAGIPTCITWVYLSFCVARWYGLSRSRAINNEILHLPLCLVLSCEHFPLTEAVHCWQQGQ